MDEITVDRGIPLPKKNNARPYATKPHRVPHHYPWRTMHVGDSFLAPVDVSQQNMTRAAANRGEITGQKFTTRKIQVDGVTRVRVWRIA